jgi:hypothetical protein
VLRSAICISILFWDLHLDLVEFGDDGATQFHKIAGGPGAGPVSGSSLVGRMGFGIGVLLMIE